MEQTLLNPPVLFSKQHVFTLNWQWKAFFFLRQTSPLTSQQLERIRIGTLFWVLASALSFPLESRNNHHCSSLPHVVFVDFGGASLYHRAHPALWGGSEDGWQWGLFLHFFKCIFYFLLHHCYRDTPSDAPEWPWCLYVANGVTGTSETIQRNNSSKGNMISWWILSDLMWDMATDVLPPGKMKIISCLYLQFKVKCREASRVLLPQLSGNKDFMSFNGFAGGKFPFPISNIGVLSYFAHWLHSFKAKLCSLWW